MLVGDVSVVVHHVQRLCLRQRHAVDAPVPVGGAVHLLVVAHQQLAVGGEVNVHFHHVGTSVDACFEGCERVFGSQRGATAVSHDEAASK